MKIVADENLKYAEQLFAEYGELQLLPGREINRSAVVDADVLLIRSVTKVDEQLLTGSRVKFVGTATSGVEHVDQVYLKTNGIHFAHAKGSNAVAVAEYCLAALCLSHEAGNFDLQTDRVGIVGCGFVGSALAKLLRELNIPVSVFDPLLDDEKLKLLSQAGIDFVDLPEIFSCSAVSLHVPLTVSGAFTTHNMIDASLLARLSPTSTFINASRGGVVNEHDLLNYLNGSPNAFAALDVWESEPKIDQALRARANIATPHMAGYSRKAKARATEMLRQQYCVNHLQQPREVRSSDSEGAEVATSLDVETAISAMQKALPLDSLTADYKRQCLSAQPQTQASVFDSFRKSMIDRAEFSDYAISAAKLSGLEIERIRRLGFAVTEGIG